MDKFKTKLLLEKLKQYDVFELFLFKPISNEENTYFDFVYFYKIRDSVFSGNCRINDTSKTGITLSFDNYYGILKDRVINERQTTESFLDSKIDKDSKIEYKDIHIMIYHNILNIDYIYGGNIIKDSIDCFYDIRKRTSKLLKKRQDKLSIYNEITKEYKFIQLLNEFENY